LAFISAAQSVGVSLVTFVSPTQATEIFGNVTTPFGPLTICNLSMKILRRSSQWNSSVGGGVKPKRGSQIWRFLTFPRLYLGNGTKWEVSY